MDSDLSTRDRLLEAAIAIIEDEGEAGVRVDRVAERAGFTKPVVYHYFEDREALVVAALAERYYRSISYAMEEFRFAAARCKTIEQYRDLLIRQLAAFGDAEGVHRRQLRIESLGAAVSRPELQRSLVEATQRQAQGFADILRIGQEEGWIQLEVDPLDLSIWWQGVMLSRHLVEIDVSPFETEVWDAISKWVIEQMVVEG